MSLYSSEFGNVTQYLLNRNRKKTFVFKPKRCAGVANNLRSIRGMMMLSMANNANFCIKYPDFFTIMNDSFKFLNCPSTLKTVQWKHDYMLVGQQEVIAIIISIAVLKSKQVMILHHHFSNANTSIMK